MRANGFLTSREFIWDDWGRISNGPISTDFEQEPWAIAHCFNMADFDNFLTIPKLPKNVEYMRANGFLTPYGFIWDDLGRISNGAK